MQRGISCASIAEAPALGSNLRDVGLVLGRIDEAVERLERAIEARNSAVVFVRHTFNWENMRLDPRMDEILGAVGL